MGRRNCLVVVEKFLLAVPEFEPLTSHPVAIRNTDCAFKWNERDVKFQIVFLIFNFFVFCISNTDRCTDILSNHRLTNTIHNSDIQCG